MPASFDACVAAGGKVITKTPEPGKYLHICYPKGGGAPVAGEVKTAKKAPIKKVNRYKMP